MGPIRPAFGELDRVPEYLPFVVRTSPARFAAWVGGATLAGYLGYCVVLGGLVLLVARDTADGAAISAVAGLLGILGFLLGVPAAVLQRRFLGHGPLLAAGADGVCARPARRGAPAIWVPWSRIQSIYVRRRWYGDVVQVRTGGHPAGTYPPYAPDDLEPDDLVDDPQLAVVTRIADHSADEIVSALRALAAGRVPVYSRGAWTFTRPGG